jgi:3D (Asp-Asp-Asp) domain-containing protein
VGFAAFVMAMLLRPSYQQTLPRVTAYCATGSLNAAGHYPRAGEAAGNQWPLGTQILVPGYGFVTVEDRIGHGSDLDLYFGARPDCVRAADTWGARRLTVTVYRRPRSNVTRPTMASTTTTIITTRVTMLSMLPGGRPWNTCC